MKPKRRAVWIQVLMAAALLLRAPASAAEESTADHGRYEALKGPFDGIEDITRACIECHNQAPAQLHATLHWTWSRDDPASGKKVGKRHVLNNFYGGVGTNLAGCTTCHIGFGWVDDTFDFANAEAVDCMVCHDTTGRYVFERFHQDGAPCGVCHDERLRKTDIETEPLDLAEAARKVGATSRVTSRATCGACHFGCGGSDGAKHGDLDSSLVTAPKALDVHMSPQGEDLSCAKCHRSGSHRVAGSRYDLTVEDPKGIDPINGNRGTCQSCHGTLPHDDRQIDRHTNRIACQTCHIPAMARGGKPTKTRWDWSTAGKRDRRGRATVKKDDLDRVVYATQKGSYEWGENLVPEYIWFNGDVVFARPGDGVGPDNPVPINRYAGGPDDPGSRIYTVKIMRSLTPLDEGDGALVPPHLYGRDRDAYWTSYKWDRALEAGTAALDLAFSGTPGFVETEMVWPLAHMVAPADRALACVDCHAPQGRLAKIDGVYIPGRNRNPMLDMVGLAPLGLALAGALLHGLLRLGFILFMRRPT